MRRHPRGLSVSRPVQQIAVCAREAQSDPFPRRKPTLDEVLRAACPDARAEAYGESGSRRPAQGSTDRARGPRPGRAGGAEGRGSRRRWLRERAAWPASSGAFRLRGSGRWTGAARCPGGYRRGERNGTGIVVKKCPKGVGAGGGRRRRRAVRADRGGIGRWRRRRIVRSGGGRVRSRRAGARGSREERGSRSGPGAKWGSVRSRGESLPARCGRRRALCGRCRRRTGHDGGS